MKAYLYLGKKELWGYEIIKTQDSLWLEGSDSFVLAYDKSNDAIIEKIRDKNFKAKKGDSLYFMPPCSYAMDDIRKNYTVKRKLDTGSANVINPECLSTTFFTTFHCLHILYNDDKKEVILLTKLSSDSTIENICKKTWGISNYGWYHTSYGDSSRLYKVTNPALMTILEGKATKPCITYDDLDMSSSIDLNYETLLLVSDLARKSDSQDNIEKLKIEMMAMNNQDWRAYPGTMRVLYWTHLTKWNAFFALANHISTCPKPIKEMLAVGHSKSKFVSEEDLKMGQKLLGHLLDMDVSKTSYLDFGTLQCVAKLKSIPYDILSETLGCITRVKAYTYEQYQNYLSCGARP